MVRTVLTSSVLWLSVHETVFCGPTGPTVVVDSAEAASEALAVARPGHVIVLKDGVYDGFRLAVNGLGTLEQPIRLRAENPGQARLTGASHIEIGGEHVIVEGILFDQAWGENVVAFAGATHCQLTGCAFLDCGDPKRAYRHILTLADHSRHNRVHHCYMEGNLSIGMAVRIRAGDYQNTHNQFDHNYFKDILRRSRNGQEAVQIGQGGFSDRTSQFAVVEHCLFDNASGDAEIISNKSSDNIYRYNTFRNCKAMLVLRGGNRAWVEGNFFFNNLGGIRVHNSDHVIVNNYIEGSTGPGIYMPTGARHYGPVNYCVVAHNTIVNCARGLHVGQRNVQATEWDLKIAWNDFLKNLVVSDHGVAIQDDGSHVSTWRGNMVWTTGDARPGLEHEGVALADPGLVRQGGILRLGSADSPAVNGPSVDFRDVRAAVPGAETDVDSQPRDDLPDVGCDEWSEESARRGPMSPEEVGPDWMRGDPSSLPRLPRREPP
ncbi:MAG: polysaccharide lyase 6 family protein [Planctomycetota bacterium]|jgi:hypothetical protein